MDRLGRHELDELTLRVLQCEAKDLPGQRLEFHGPGSTPERRIESAVELLEALVAIPAETDPRLGIFLLHALSTVIRRPHGDHLAEIAGREIISLLEPFLRRLLQLLRPEFVLDPDRNDLGYLIETTRKLGLLPGDRRRDLHTEVLKKVRKTEDLARYGQSAFGELLRQARLTRNERSHWAAAHDWLPTAAVVLKTLDHSSSALCAELGLAAGTGSGDRGDVLPTRLRVAGTVHESPLSGNMRLLPRDPRGASYVDLDTNRGFIITLDEGEKEPSSAVRSALRTLDAAWLTDRPVWVTRWPLDLTQMTQGGLGKRLAEEHGIRLTIFVEPPLDEPSEPLGLPAAGGVGARGPSNLPFDVGTCAALDRREVGIGKDHPGSTIHVVQTGDPIEVLRELRALEATVETALEQTGRASDHWPRRFWVGHSLSGGGRGDCEGDERVDAWWGALGPDHGATRGFVLGPDAPAGLKWESWLPAQLNPGARLHGHGIVVCIPTGANELASDLRRHGLPARALLVRPLPDLSGGSDDAVESRVDPPDPFDLFEGGNDLRQPRNTAPLAVVAAWLAWARNASGSSRGAAGDRGLDGRRLEAARDLIRMASLDPPTAEAVRELFSKFGVRSTPDETRKLVHAFLDLANEGNITHDTLVALLRWICGIVPGCGDDLDRVLGDLARDTRALVRASVLDLWLGVRGPSALAALAAGGGGPLLKDSTLAAMRAGLSPAALLAQLPAREYKTFERAMASAAQHPPGQGTTPLLTRCLAHGGSAVAAARESEIAWASRSQQLSPPDRWWLLQVTPPSPKVVRAVLEANREIRSVAGLLAVGEAWPEEDPVCRAIREGRREQNLDP